MLFFSSGAPCLPQPSMCGQEVARRFQHSWSSSKDLFSYNIAVETKFVVVVLFFGKVSEEHVISIQLIYSSLLVVDIDMACVCSVFL